MRASRVRACLGAALLVAVCALQACAIAPALKVEPGGQIQKNLRYDLILYGGSYMGDLHTIAIMGIEGSPYRIVPYAPAFDYGIIKGLSAGVAQATAVRFFSLTNPDFIGTRQSRILAPDGRVIGYEIRPLYQPFVYGLSDVLDTSYWLKGHGIVSAWIQLKSGINRPGGGEETGRPFGHAR